MTVYAPQVERTGSSSKPIAASGGSWNFGRAYYRSNAASGDIRAHYEDLEFMSTGSGETFRIRGIANGVGCAAAGTINAIHATGRLPVGKTVSGALNAIRATMESNSVTNSGTLAAIQVDSSLASGATYHPSSALIRASNSGTDKMPNLLSLPVPGAKTAAATDMFVAVHADSVVTHAIRIVDAAGTPYWIQVTTDTPGD